MRTLDKKIAMNFGKIFLVGAFVLSATAHAGKSADGGEQNLCGKIPQSLKKLRDESNPDEKCKKNKGVPANTSHASEGDYGACEGVYVAITKAINDYEDRTCKGLDIQDKIMKQENCGNGGGTAAQGNCQGQASDLQKQSAEIQKRKANAAAGLKKWIDKKKQAAEKAKEEIQNSGKQIGDRAKSEAAMAKSELAPKPDPNTAKVRTGGAIPAGMMVDAISGVSGEIQALQREQEQAIQNAEKAASALQAESVKSAASATQLDKMSKVTNSRQEGLGSTDKGNGSGQAGSQASNGQGSGQGSGAGGGGGMPSIPGGGQGGGDSGASSPMADAGTSKGTGDLSPNSVATKTDSSGKSSDMKLDTTPGKSSTGDLSPTASGEILSGTGSSKMNTSLRDALKKKILGDAGEGGSGEALGGLGFGANSAVPKKAGAPGAAAAAAGGGFSVPSFGDAGGGGDAGGADFSMSRSETDAAVHNLLNEFGNAGSSDGRAIASSSSDAAAGIEGVEGTSLIHRVHDAIVRHLKNGSVANGVNGKI